MEDPLIQIVYRSRAVGQPSELDLHPILVVAREFNAAHDITGLLLYRSRIFVQLLEGPETEVRKLYARIQADARHQAVETILDGPITTRRCGAWAMAFRVFDQLGSLPLRGLSPALEHRDIDLAVLDGAVINELLDELVDSL